MNNDYNYEVQRGGLIQLTYLIKENIVICWRFHFFQAMQTTIPYIDAQPVIPRDGIWLSGVGLYHKGHPGNN